MAVSPKKLAETQNHTFFNNYTLWQEVSVCNTCIKNTFVCQIIHTHMYNVKLLRLDQLKWL